MATTAISKSPAPPARNPVPDAAMNLRAATDDEILNLSPRAVPKKKFAAAAMDVAAGPAPQSGAAASNEADAGTQSSAGDSPVEPLAGVPQEFRAALEEHPELRSAWEDAAAFRESFGSPEEAREATRLVGDLNRLDALFFSARPEDHAELARVVSALDPAAAASLAWALSRVATEAQSDRGSREGNRDSGAGQGTPPENTTRRPAFEVTAAAPRESQVSDHQPQNSPTPAQTEFFHAANTAAVEGVLGAIHAQVDRLLPEGTSQAARNRVVGEIYRELDASLRSNRQLGEQLRQAFQSGALDAAHQRSVVSLITNRARQALPGVAKRVMSEWTAALVSAGADRRARQRAAESRVDIGGSGRTGAEGRRTLSPREIDYSRLTDADILNL